MSDEAIENKAVKAAGGPPKQEPRLRKCKKDGCQEPRRDKSAYCQGCSDKHKAAKIS